MSNFGVCVDVTANLPVNSGDGGGDMYDNNNHVIIIILVIMIIEMFWRRLQVGFVGGEIMASEKFWIKRKQQKHRKHVRAACVYLRMRSRAASGSAKF